MPLQTLVETLVSCNIIVYYENDFD